MKEFLRRHPVLPFAARGIRLRGLPRLDRLRRGPAASRRGTSSCRPVPRAGLSAGTGRSTGPRSRRTAWTFSVVTSLGNVENLRRLKDPASGVVAGFVSGGLTTASGVAGPPVPRDDLVRPSLDLLPRPARARPDDGPRRQARVDRSRGRRHPRDGPRAAPREPAVGRVHGAAAHAGQRRGGAPQGRDRLRVHADERRRADRQDAARRRARRARGRSRARTRTWRSTRT